MRKSIFQKIIVFSLCLLLQTTILLCTPLSSEASTTSARYGGADRYETSSLIAKAAFVGAKADNVIIAPGEDWAYALMGSPLSSALNAPILLVGKSPAQNKHALDFINNNLLSTGKLYVMGSQDLISESILTQAGISSSRIVRIAGTNKENTALQVATLLNQGSKADTIIVATNNDYPDALSVSGYAANQKAPIFLIPSTSTLPVYLSDYLKSNAPSRAIIIGGTSVISQGAENQLKGLVADVQRYAGADRYGTSRLIINALYNRPAEVCLAYGQSFADAVAGSAFAAKYNAPILVIPKSLDASTENFLQSKGTNMTFTYFGGTSVISTATENRLASLFPASAVGSVLIEYSNPQKYLASGEQTTLSNAEFQTIDQQLGIKTKTLEDVGRIFQWMKANIKGVPAGGAYIGTNTVSRILQTKESTGCHDDALLMSSILRRCRIPAIVLDATGIQFSLDYPLTRGFSGHVFVELYLDGKWILFDSSSGEYIVDYDHNNPVIPITKPVESKGYYVMFKGIDTVGYGIESNRELTNKMAEYAGQIKKIDIVYPNYVIGKFR